MLKRLAHPHIVGYEGHFVEDNRMNILTEFASGGTLEEAVVARKGRGKRFDEDTVWAYFCQLVLALQHMHSKHVLHRDIKTQNILLTGHEKRTVKVADLGLAHQLPGPGGTASEMVGTPYYLSPELVQGRPYDSRSDVWALGCVMFELVSLRKPFEGRNVSELLRRIIEQERNDVPADVDPLLRQLCNQMLSPEEEDRPTIDDLYRRPEVQERLRHWKDEWSRLQALNEADLKRYNRAGMEGGAASVESSAAAEAARNEYPLNARAAQKEAKKLLQNNLAYIWGLGKRRPRLQEAMMSRDFASVHAGGTFAVARTTRGELLTWAAGTCERGQLGHGPGRVAQRNPHRIASLVRKQVLVSSVAAGETHAAAVSDGEVLVWGEVHGAKGLSVVPMSEVPDPPDYSPPDEPENALPAAGLGKTFGATARELKVAAGGAGGSAAPTTALSASVQAASDAAGGPRVVDQDSDDPESVCYVFEPSFVTTIEVPIAVSVACGRHSTFVLMSNGQVWAFGIGDDYRLGLGHDDSVVTPTRIERWMGADGVELDEPPKVAHVAAGTDHVIAVAADAVYTWGCAEQGRLGLGGAVVDDGAAKVPTAIAELRGKGIVYAAAGARHSAVVSEEGRLWCFGANEFGQLGLGDDSKVEEALSPVEVTAMEGKRVATVACGEASTVARVQEEGRVYAWGCNEGGRLGVGDDVGDDARIATPRLVQGVRNTLAVESGRWPTLALGACVVKAAYGK